MAKTQTSNRNRQAERSNQSGRRSSAIPNLRFRARTSRLSRLNGQFEKASKEYGALLIRISREYDRRFRQIRKLEDN
jgi:hypothetical protein